MDEAFINGAWVAISNPIKGIVLGHRVLKTSGYSTEVTEFNMLERTDGVQRFSYDNSESAELFDFVRTPIGRGTLYEIPAAVNLKFELSVDVGSDTAVTVEI